MKLMIVGAQLGTLTNGEKDHLIDYHQCIDAVTCNEASSSTTWVTAHLVAI